MIFSPIGDRALRLRQFRVEKKLSQAQVASVLDISTPAYTKIETGRGGLTIENLGLLTEAYGLNPLWYLAGEGSMLLLDMSDTPKPVEDLTLLSARAVPLYGSYNAIAGVVAGAEATAQIGSLTISGVRADCAIVVSGNSMEPRYIPGDYVLLRESRPDYIEYGQPYVVELATGDVLLKVLRNSDTKHVILESENRALYSPMVVDRRDIARLYKVIGMFRKEAQ